jgi:hypothetical protein
MVYENDTMRISFNLDKDRIGFRLDNKLNDALQIRWDEASVSIKGKTYRVAHKETGAYKIRDLQPITTIPPKSYTKDGLIPTEKINYFNVSGDPIVYVSEIFPDCDYGKDTYKQKISSLRGANIMVYLPIYIAGNYAAKNFQITIRDITPKKGK